MVRNGVVEGFLSLGGMRGIGPAVVVFALGAISSSVLSCPETEYEWIKLDVTGPPAGPAAMTYDSKRGRVMLWTIQNDETYGQLWSWDGDAWHLASEGGPFRRAVQAITYDRRNDHVVLFGGWTGTNYSDTWIWNGSDWLEATPSSNNPSPRRFNALVYDEATERVIMFGGIGDGCSTIKNDTWAWDGLEWLQVSDPAPIGLVGSTAIYSEQFTSAVRFGGQLSCGGGFAGTLQLLGETGWEPVAQGPMAPSSRKNAGVAPIGNEGHLVLFGGESSAAGGAVKGDTWLWGGTAWTELAIPGPPARGYSNGFFGMAHDEARGEIVMFGGAGDNWAMLGDTWVLRAIDNTCPADLNHDGIVDNGDIITFIDYIFAGDSQADMNCDGINDNGDIGAFITLFLEGC